MCKLKIMIDAMFGASKIPVQLNTKVEILKQPLLSALRKLLQY